LVTIKLAVGSKYCLFSLFLKIWFVLHPQPTSNDCHDQRLCKTIIIARGNWEIYRNPIVRVERTNVFEKFPSSNSVANQIVLNWPLGFWSLQRIDFELYRNDLNFEANRLRVVTKRVEANRLCSETTLNYSTCRFTLLPASVSLHRFWHLCNFHCAYTNYVQAHFCCKTSFQVS